MKRYDPVQTDENIDETNDSLKLGDSNESDTFMNKEIFSVWVGLAKGELNMLIPATLALLIQTSIVRLNLFIPNINFFSWNFICSPFCRKSSRALS
jgi:hypothetical protein